MTGTRPTPTPTAEPVGDLAAGPVVTDLSSDGGPRPSTRVGPPWIAPDPGGSVWANSEFRALWAAFGWSLVGDQLARVALVVLLYSATGSAVWAVAGSALTLVAPMIGAPVLSPLADRWPRRRVMIACDLASAVLIATMAVPGMPLPVMVGLLGVASLLSAPFGSARSALGRDVFADDRRYAASIGVSGLTARVAITAGTVLGGVAVAALGARVALLLDAATFAASALLLWGFVAVRPAARTGPSPAGSGVRLVFGTPALRTPAMFGWLASFYVAPLAVAAPYAAKHGGGPVMVGTLLAVQTAGAGLATWYLTTRVPPAEQPRWLVPGAVLACAPLILTATDPGVPAVAVLWALSGAGTAYQIVANTAFQRAVPNEQRAAAFGVVSAVLLAGQGIGLLAVAALAGPLGPTGAVAVFGAIGTLAAFTLAPTGRRLTATTPTPGPVSAGPALAILPVPTAGLAGRGTDSGGR